MPLIVTPSLLLCTMELALLRLLLILLSLLHSFSSLSSSSYNSHICRLWFNDKIDKCTEHIVFSSSSFLLLLLLLLVQKCYTVLVVAVGTERLPPPPTSLGPKHHHTIRPIIGKKRIKAVQSPTTMVDSPLRQSCGKRGRGEELHNDADGKRKRRGR